MNTHRMLLCCVALAGSLLAGPVRAQTMAPAPTPASSAPISQVVRLLDGSVYQGELVELVPGDHLTIRLADGTIKRFSYSEIQPPAAPALGPVPGILGGVILPPVPTVVTTPALPPPGPDDLVQLHFQASDPAAVLFSTDLTSNIHFNNPAANSDPLTQDWTMVCPRSPCDIRADRRRVYSVEGPGIIRSLPFTLPQNHAVVADATVAHHSTRTFLRLLSTVGGIAAATGLTMFILGGIEGAESTPTGTDPLSVQMAVDAQNRQRTYYIAGGVLAGAGAVMLVTGIVTSALLRTNLNFSSDGHLALRLPGKAELELAPLQVRF